ncbi:MAG: RNA 3'-terminal phosphate cyclase [Archaeoglobaceae archaeon]
MIRIDGSYGEGGGQILRTAIALSCVTGEAVVVENIRAKRPKPGLAAQHLKGIEAAKLISDAEVEGLRIGSTRVVFKPRRLRGGNFKVDIGTAGSVTLVMQTILPPLLFAEKESSIEIIGGTDVAWSPPIDYFRFVTLPAVAEIGGEASIELLRRGYYPKGGGRVRLSVRPSELSGKIFERKMGDVTGISHCQNLPPHVAERQARAAVEFLAERGVEAKIDVEVRSGISTGSGITIWSGYKGGNALGEKGKRAEVVGEEAAREFYGEYSSEAAVDRHLGDQLMTFAAIAKGKTEYTTTSVTLHQISNAYVINLFFDGAVEIDEERKLIKIRGL